ncbi:MAG: Txe/YoeB family addiction module toxin [Selenomonadaceae bacterium]|nr:Txe/YoeB family addiction module toxin [Selenomonadaceae bacterium]MBP3723618.1 Txe/YoeB family addiction module toxin [Selenomonadaceae bacterium]
MNTVFIEKASEEYSDWLRKNRKIAEKIWNLIKSIRRDGPMQGLGKPEKLKYEDTYSRRIDEANRLVYKVSDDAVSIISCQGHYND